MKGPKVTVHKKDVEVKWDGETNRAELAEDAVIDAAVLKIRSRGSRPAGEGALERVRIINAEE